MELSSEAMGFLPPGIHRETFPIMAHELGYDSIQIQNGGELVMTSIECMFQSRNASFRCGSLTSGNFLVMLSGVILLNSEMYAAQNFRSTDPFSI